MCMVDVRAALKYQEKSTCEFDQSNKLSLPEVHKLTSIPSALDLIHISMYKVMMIIIVYFTPTP